MVHKKLCLGVVSLALAMAVSAVAESKIEPPVPVRTVAPEYPDALKRDGAMGIVVVDCTVDEQGNVVDPQVAKSSNKGFDGAALDAVKRWKFKPAKRDGNPIARKVSIPIKFVLDS